MATLVQRDLQFDRTEQATNLARASGRIASHVQHYLNVRIGEVFTSADLAAYVVEQVGYVAPGSPDRVMRDLRKAGLVAYELVSRAKSQYRAMQPTGGPR